MNRRTLTTVLFVCVAVDGVHAQLFDNLDAFGRRLDIGDPEVRSTWRGGHEGQFQEVWNQLPPRC